MRRGAGTGGSCERARTTFDPLVLCEMDGRKEKLVRFVVDPSPQA